MNELNKLIEQYERENLGKKAFIPERLGFCEGHYSNQFIIWSISELATRPTCGKEQRKFLDEVEKLESSVFGLLKWKDTIAVNKDVFKSDLDKVIKGK